MNRKLPVPMDQVKPHRHYDKLVSAAYLRMIGLTQAAAAKGVGVSVETIQNWEKHEAWPVARAEARERWLVDVEDEARAAILTQLKKGDGDLGLKVLERLDPGLAPPKQKTELTGPGGGPVQLEHIAVTRRVIDADGDA